jgi:hypothetical protein
VSNRDPLWVVFPRWLEESGLPERMAEEIGPESWLLFRKLVELDCDANLTPQWFAIGLSDLVRWTGISRPRIELLLRYLEEMEWIERIDADFESQTCRIVTPLKVPLEENTIRSALAGFHGCGGRFILRYYQNTASLNAVENVIYLYQMLFGARFSPRIVEDLEDIANTYDMGVIYDIFAEAYAKKAKSLAWIKSHLASEVKQPAENQECET